MLCSCSCGGGAATSCVAMSSCCLRVVVGMHVCAHAYMSGCYVCVHVVAHSGRANAGLARPHPVPSQRHASGMSMCLGVAILAVIAPPGIQAYVDAKLPC